MSQKRSRFQTKKSRLGLEVLGKRNASVSSLSPASPFHRHPYQGLTYSRHSETLYANTKQISTLEGDVMPDEDEPPLLELPRTLRVAFSETAATKKHTIIRMVYI